MLNTHKIFRVFFILIVIGFLSYMGFSVYFRSKENESILENLSSIKKDGEREENKRNKKKRESENIKNSKEVDSELQLQEFHRVQITKGRKEWEVTAKDAEYFRDEGVIQVSDAFLVVYRKGESPVTLKAKSARLLFDKNVLKGVDLEGEIIVRDESSFILTTNLASFNILDDMLKSPSLVVIEGESYNIRGVGLNLNIKTRELKLLKEVRSKFINLETIKTKSKKKGLLAKKD